MAQSAPVARLNRLLGQVTLNETKGQETEDKKQKAAQPKYVFLLVVAHETTDLTLFVTSIRGQEKDSLTVIDNRSGKSYEIPIRHNTIDAQKLGQIKAKPNLPGLR